MERDEVIDPIEEIITWNVIAGNEGNREDKAVTYIDLVKEEHKEWLDALEASDATEELDAIVDQIWVLVGRAHSKGYDILGAINEVAESNFSKFFLSEEDGNIRREVQRYAEEGVVVTPRERFGVTVLVDQNGKIRKPSHYKKADCSKYTKMRKASD